MEKFIIFVALLAAIFTLVPIAKSIHRDIVKDNAVKEILEKHLNYYKTQTLEWELFHYVYSTTDYEGNRIPDMVTPNIYIPESIIMPITPAEGNKIWNEHLNHFGTTDPNEEYADHEYE